MRPGIFPYSQLIPVILLLLNYTGIYAQERKVYPASRFPDRVILGFKGDPAHSQAVNWRTDSNIVSGVAAIHEADPSPGFVPNARIVNALSHNVALDNGQACFHEVNFTDLKPSTQYM